MSNHVKPSKEELKARIKATEDNLDSILAEDPNNLEPTPAPIVPTVPEILPGTPPAEDPNNLEPTPAPKTPEELTVEDNVDYKAKAAASAREAQILSFKNKEVNKAIQEAATLPEPTDEELQTEYTDWEDMTPTEQRLAKDNLVNKRKFELLHTATSKFAQVDEWNEKVDTFVADPKTLTANPALEGKQEEFKHFASKPTRRGVDMDTLVLAFLGEQAQHPKPTNKGKQMFEKGTGGSNIVPTPPDDRLSVEEGRELRKTNYKEWSEKLRAGKIKAE